MGGDSLTGFTGKHAHRYIRDFIVLEDGFWYFWAESPDHGGGAMASYELRWIAALLDWVNKPWQDQIDEYHKDEIIKDEIVLDIF